MARQRFSLTDDQVKELTTAYATSTVGRVRTRYQAVRLYGTGYPMEEVRDITGCSRTSLLEWCRVYRITGVAGLVDQRKGGNRARLTASQLQTLRRRLQTYTPVALFGAATACPDGRSWTVDDLERAVERWYQVRYHSRGSSHRLFARCGFSYQRPAHVYTSRSAQAVAAFEEALEKNMTRHRPRRAQDGAAGRG
jgi:transposase